MSSNENLVIVFDTETTGFDPIENEVVQLSYILYDVSKQKVVYATKPGEDIVNIKGDIPKETSDVHGITKDMTLDKRSIKEHIDEFIGYCNQAGRFVGHNIKFDIMMITGQIQKTMQEFPETSERYKTFLERFQMVGNDLPEAAYCTMIESQGICAKIRGRKRLKWEKLMEVHKLLFNQDVGGQLHNALVDISVTLRVYLKLVIDVDICLPITEFNNNVNEVTDNYSICSLIKPIPIVDKIKNINYSGDLITGLNMVPTGIEEDKIMVKTSAQKSVSNTKPKVAPQPICTNISICRTIIKSGKRSEQQCGRPATINNEFCGIHYKQNVTSYGNKSTKNKKQKTGNVGGKKRKTKKSTKKRRSFKRKNKYSKIN
jgi:DNA polymerase III epsilon subunit-like protein